MIENLAETTKKSIFKRIFKYTYFSVIHILAIVALFLMFTALAVKFRWSNQKGNVDINNRYFQQIADKYGKDMTIDAKNVAKEQSLLMQRIGILAKYQPVDAKTIQDVYTKTGDIIIASRMLDAVALMLKDNKKFNAELKQLSSNTPSKSMSIYEFSNYKVWKDFCKAVRHDSKAIDSVAKITGVEARLIVMCLVGEQVRMFNSGRERFKQYVMPFSRIMMPTNRGYGVTGILEHTALRIERNLIDTKSPFYPGDYFYRCLNVNDSFPHVVNDSISAHRHKTIQRLIAGGDHYYSYLYTAFLLRQYQAHWESKGFDLSKRPEILGTLFNIGFHKSIPKANPEAGGSSFKVGNKEYTFGGLCFEFYYSGELNELFPITPRAFIPVKELEVINKDHLERIQAQKTGQ
jgi:hypothetical protein